MWISVDDRLPDHQVDVLFLSNDEVYQGWCENYFLETVWFEVHNSYIVGDVTHWMPIAEAKQ